MLAEFPAAFALATGFDPSLTLSAAIAAAAAALSGEFQIVGNSRAQWFEQALLWILGIGRPAAGKTPSQDAMLKPLWELHSEMVKAYEQQVAEIAASDDDEKPPRIPRPRVIVRDATIEALTEVLKENPRGILIATDEFESWLGGLDAYRRGAVSRDRGEWLRIFQGGPHTIERVQRGSVYVENWAASILSATTPSVLEKLARSLPEDGLLQRFIPVIARPMIEARPVENLNDLRDRYRETIRRLYFSSPRAHNGCVPLSTEAQAFFTAWLAQNRITAEAFGSINPALESHLAKYPAFLLRITLAFHAVKVMNFEHREARDPAAWPVPCETIETAARFLKRARLHAIALYLDQSGSEAFELARDTARAILSRDRTHIARRDLVQTVRAFRKAAQELQDATLRLLVDLGWLRPQAAEEGYSKPVPARYAINPGLGAKFAQLAERERARRAVAREAIAEVTAFRRGSP
jgi:hypothetical protein